MSSCSICGRRESFNLGTNSENGWTCSRCSGVGVNNSAFANVATVLYQGAHMAGVLGALRYDGAEDAAIRNIVASPQHDGQDETFRNVGAPAKHQTTPRSNITFVYTRVGGAVTIYAVGRHVGRGNNNYRIMRWNGSGGTVTRP